MTKLVALLALTSALLVAARSAHSDPLPTVEQAEADAVEQAAGYLHTSPDSDSAWEAVEVGAPTSMRLAVAWTAMHDESSSYAIEDAGRDDCWAQRVATSNGVRWLPICIHL